MRRRKGEPQGARPPIEILGPGVVRFTSRAGKTRVLIFTERFIPMGFGVVARKVVRREFLEDVDGIDLTYVPAPLREEWRSLTVEDDNNVALKGDPPN